MIGKVALKVFGLQQEAKAVKRGLAILKEIKSSGIGKPIFDAIEESKEELKDSFDKVNKTFDNIKNDKFVRDAFIKSKAKNAVFSKKAQSLYEDYRLNNSVSKTAQDQVLKKLKQLPPAKLYQALKDQKLKYDQDKTVSDYYAREPYEVMFNSSFIKWAIFDLLPGEKDRGYITIKATGKSSINPGSVYIFPAVFPRKVWDQMLIANVFGGSIGQTFWIGFFRRWRKLGKKSDPFKVKSWTKKTKYKSRKK